MNGSLHVIFGAGVQRVIPLKLGRYDIGREEKAAIQIDSREVSRKHAEVIVDDRGVRLLDCDSANGTFLNGSQVKTADLQSGDRITIGGVILEYHAPKEPEKSVRTMRTSSRLDVGSPAVRPRSLRRLFTLTFALALSSLVLAGGLSYRTILESRLTVESNRRAHGLVRYLAVKNREDLRIGNELLLDIDTVLQEAGVREAYIINAKGRILAPISQMNRAMNDPFVTEALAQQSDRTMLPSPKLSNGTRVFVHPIRAYNDNVGTYETLGVAKIVFSATDAAGSFDDANRLLILLLAAALGLAILLGWASSRMLATPLNHLAERVHRWRAGVSSQREESPFHEWKALFDAVKRITEDKR